MGVGCEGLWGVCKVCGEYSGGFLGDVRDGLWVWGVRFVGGL